VPVSCPGGVNIKPPLEVGVGDFDEEDNQYV